MRKNKTKLFVEKIFYLNMSLSPKDACNDLANLGQNCSFKACSRLDFLPIKCDLCALVFCKEHSSLSSHLCEKYNQLSQKKQSEKKPLEPVQFYQCSFESCANQKEIVSICCEFCKLNFCLKHRLVVDHNCTARSELLKPDSNNIDKNKTAKPAEFKFEMKQNVSDKNVQLAAKLLIMKLRQTAIGPPGLTEQFKYYCYVECNKEKKPFYFSTKWPIGKCIEFVFEKLRISISELSKFKFYLEDSLIESSNNIEDLIKKEVLASPGLTLVIKNVTV